MEILLFLIALIASLIGAITGIGGGVIVKPCVDLFNILPAQKISFLSGCMVLSMVIVSLFRNRKSSVKIEYKILTPLAIGAAIGGIIGNIIFKYINSSLGQNSLVLFIQSAILFVLVIFVFFYTIFLDKITTYKITNAFIITIVGLMLGFCSSFLGIGGGPINLAILTILFSMSSKKTSISSLFIILFSQTANLLFSIFTNTIPSFEIAHLILMIAGGILGGILGSNIFKRINDDVVLKLYKLLLIVIILICMINMIRYGIVL